MTSESLMSPGVEAPFVVPLGHVSSFFVCLQLLCCRRSVDPIPFVEWTGARQLARLRFLPMCFPQKSSCREIPGMQRFCQSFARSLLFLLRGRPVLALNSLVAAVSGSWVCLQSSLVCPSSRTYTRWHNVPLRHKHSMSLPLLGCWLSSSCKTVMCVLEFRRIHTSRCCCLSVHSDIRWLCAQLLHI